MITVESVRDPDWRATTEVEAIEWLLDYFSRCGDDYRPKGTACTRLLEGKMVERLAQLYGFGDE